MDHDTLQAILEEIASKGGSSVKVSSVLGAAICEILGTPGDLHLINWDGIRIWFSEVRCICFRNLVFLVSSAS